MAALIAGHNVETLGEQIDDLAFAFIAPLGAYDDDDFGHDSMPIADFQFPIRRSLKEKSWQSVMAIETASLLFPA